MNANELRIGNWLNAPNYNINQPIRGLFQVEAWHIVSMVEFEKTAKRFVNWQPIPLTNEWILKFGLDEKWFMQSKLMFHKISVGYNVISNGHKIAWLKYVHQLQNLYFACSGEELTIN